MPQRRTEAVACDMCGDTFLITKTRAKESLRHFCTKACQAEFQRGTFPQAARDARMKYPESLRTGEKMCPKCGIVKPLSEFGIANNRGDGRKVYCKMCRKQEDNDPEFRRARGRRYVYKGYGITEAEYDALVLAQDGLCAICHRPNLKGRRLYVDHCHRSGIVRGLLCQLCNSMLGMIDDDVDVLVSAISYLRERGVSDAES